MLYLSAQGKDLEKYWENELEYNKRLQGSKYMFKEYREYIKEKKTKIKMASPLLPLLSF